MYKGQGPCPTNSAVSISFDCPRPQGGVLSSMLRLDSPLIRVELLVLGYFRRGLCALKFLFGNLRSLTHLSLFTLEELQFKRCPCPFLADSVSISFGSSCPIHLIEGDNKQDGNRCIC